MIEFCLDGRKFGRDRNSMRTEISQVKFVATKISMSQQTSSASNKDQRRNPVATKKNYIATEIVKEQKKSYSDRVDRLKRKMLVVIRKIMSRHFLEASV